MSWWENIIPHKDSELRLRIYVLSFVGALLILACNLAVAVTQQLWPLFHYQILFWGFVGSIFWTGHWVYYDMSFQIDRIIILRNISIFTFILAWFLFANLISETIACSAAGAAEQTKYNQCEADFASTTSSANIRTYCLQYIGIDVTVLATGACPFTLGNMGSETSITAAEWILVIITMVWLFYMFLLSHAATQTEEGHIYFQAHGNYHANPDLYKHHIQSNLLKIRDVPFSTPTATHASKPVVHQAPLRPFFHNNSKLE